MQHHPYNINSLLNLLDDSDNEVFLVIQQELVSAGKKIIPALEKYWEESNNPIVQKRVEDIISQIQTNLLKYEFNIWLSGYSDNLFFGSYLIARHHYPSLEYNPLLNFIEEIAEKIHKKIYQGQPPVETIQILNHIFFEEYGFKANIKNILSPSNCYINRVIEGRQGNAVTLAILYISIAKRLHIPLAGVNLPNNFVIAYYNPNQNNYFTNNKIQFYIDPLGKGMILTRQDIEKFIKRLGITPHESFFNPCSNLKTIQRLLSTLILCLEKQQKLGITEQLKELFSMLSLKIAEI